MLAVLLKTVVKTCVGSAEEEGVLLAPMVPFVGLALGALLACTCRLAASTPLSTQIQVWSYVLQLSLPLVVQSKVLAALHSIIPFA